MNAIHNKPLTAMGNLGIDLKMKTGYVIKFTLLEYLTTKYFKMGQH